MTELWLDQCMKDVLNTRLNINVEFLVINLKLRSLSCLDTHMLILYQLVFIFSILTHFFGEAQVLSRKEIYLKVLSISF